MIAQTLEEVYVEEEKKTPGGTTYWVERKGDGELYATCWRHVKTEEAGWFGRCTRSAGYGTDHTGTGACMYHGGSISSTNAQVQVVNGRQSDVTKKSLRERISSFIESGDSSKLYDLTIELATIRVLFQDLLDDAPPSDDKKAYTIFSNRVTAMVNGIGNLVDKISKIQSRNTLTAAQVLFLRARVADILVKYLQDPEVRLRAMEELASSIPGAQEGNPHEHIMNI